MSLKFLNSKAESFHNVAQHEDSYLLLVTCSISDNQLMTVAAYEALRAYMDEADRQSAIALQITPYSAAWVGFTKILEVNDIHYIYGNNKSGLD